MFRNQRFASTAKGGRTTALRNAALVVFAASGIHPSLAIAVSNACMVPLDEGICKAEWVGSPGVSQPGPIRGLCVYDRVTVGTAPAVRRAVSDDPNDAPVRLFRSVIEEMRKRDVDSDPGCSDKGPFPCRLDGYFALRAKHGFLDDTPEGKMLGAISSPATVVWGQCEHQPLGNTYETPLFFLWHRAYVRALEITANSILAKTNATEVSPQHPFGIPYWPWASSDRRLAAVPLPFRCPDPGGKTSNCEKLTAQELAQELKDHRNPLFHGRRATASRGAKPVWSNWSGNNPFAGDSEAAGKHNDFVRFSEEFRSSWHDQIHDGVGKDMVDTDTSVDDPLFWVHHSYVDYVMSSWILRRRDKKEVKDLFFSTDMPRAWEKDAMGNDRPFRFPVQCGTKTIWYQPRYEDLNPLGARKPGQNPDYRYVPETVLPKPMEVRAHTDVNELLKKADPISAVPSITDPSSGPKLSFKPAPANEFVIGRTGARIVSRLKDEQLRAAAMRYKTLANGLSHLEAAKSRRILVSLEGAKIDGQLSGHVTFLVHGQISCDDGHSACGEDESWFYIGTISGFGLHKSGGHHGQNSDALLDLDRQLGAKLAYFSKRNENFWRSPRSLRIELGISLVYINAANGTVSVPDTAYPDSDNIKLRFSALSFQSTSRLLHPLVSVNRH